MNITPSQVAANRTARLVREAQTPVYSTETRTPVREHVTAVEIEDDCSRRWSHMPDNEVDNYLTDMESIGYWVSDIDHSAKCWCFK